MNRLSTLFERAPQTTVHDRKKYLERETEAQILFARVIIRTKSDAEDDGHFYYFCRFNDFEKQRILNAESGKLKTKLRIHSNSTGVKLIYATPYGVVLRAPTTRLRRIGHRQLDYMGTSVLFEFKDRWNSPRYFHDSLFNLIQPSFGGPNEPQLTPHHLWRHSISQFKKSHIYMIANDKLVDLIEATDKEIYK